jgi:hypothetical protein
VVEDCTKTERFVGFCRDAIDELDKQRPTGADWERKWGSLMALLRTSSELLRGEAPVYWRLRMATPNDGKKGARGGDAKNEWEPRIYGKFIWTDANLFLHRGDLTAGQSLMIQLQGVAAQAIAAGETPKPTPPSPPPPPPRVYYHLNTGPYEGPDALRVAEEAIQWLEKQIEEARKLA